MRAVVWVGVIGCSATPSPQVVAPDAPAAVALDLDIVVDSDGVSLFTNGSDHANGCSWNGGFPQVGQVGGTTDVGCPSGCLTEVSVERDGAVIASDPRPNNHVYLAAPFGHGTEATLVITGCGGTARVPIGTQPIPVPTATVTTDPAASTVEVVWSSVPEASTAQLWFSDSYASEIHHVAAHDATFVGRPLWAWGGVTVQALTPPLPIETVFGVVRLWSGNFTFVDIPHYLRDHLRANTAIWSDLPGSASPEP